VASQQPKTVLPNLEEVPLGGNKLLRGEFEATIIDHKNNEENIPILDECLMMPAS